MLDSSIFLDKPAEWFKIWMFILLSANFEDRDSPEWTRFMQYSWIARECRLTYKQVEKALAWLKQQGMVKIERRPNGGIIEVANWWEYQGNNESTKGNRKGIERESKGNAIIYKEKNERTKENNTKVLLTELPEKKEIQKVDKRIPEIDIIINTISEHHGSIDWTALENRRYWNLLKWKLDKINWFNGDYKWFLKVILENTDEYNVTKTTSCKSLFYNLAALVAKTKSRFQEANRPKWVKTVSI
jgi:hypothetical protein